MAVDIPQIFLLVYIVSINLKLLFYSESFKRETFPWQLSSK